MSSSNSSITIIKINTIVSRVYSNWDRRESWEGILEYGVSPYGCTGCRGSMSDTPSSVEELEHHEGVHWCTDVYSKTVDIAVRLYYRYVE